MALELGTDTAPVNLPRQQRRLRTKRDIPRVCPRLMLKLMLVERRGVLRGAGLVWLGLEHVRRGRTMVCLRHHVGVRTAKLMLLVISSKQRLIFWLPGRGWEDGEVGVEVGSQKTLLKASLGLRAE